MLDALRTENPFTRPGLRGDHDLRSSGLISAVTVPLKSKINLASLGQVSRKPSASLLRSSGDTNLLR